MYFFRNFLNVMLKVKKKTSKMSTISYFIFLKFVRVYLLKFKLYGIKIFLILLIKIFDQYD